jgi:hypothetical protein
METPKRSPQEILAALEEEDIADEVDRVARLSGADVDRELAHAGLDPSVVRAGANEVFERAMRKRAEALAKASGAEPSAGGSSGSDIPRSRVVVALPRGVRRGAWRRPAVWTAAAAAAATIGVFVATNAPEIVGKGNGAHVDHDRAESLRQEATKACALSLWTTCAAQLDEARKLDPAGESEPSVKKLREELDAAGTRAPPRHD